MKRIFSLCLLLIATFNLSFSQTTESSVLQTHKGIRLSLLTCGVGTELYSAFGHSAIRVIDSAKGTDEVYNYGMFDPSTTHFYQKFTLGTLPYYIDKCSFNDFMVTYNEEDRSVDELEFILDDVDKRKIISYLENNMLPQNREYQYDFLFDNCATRIRDIFPKVLGPQFSFGEILTDKKVTFRNAIDQYLKQKHWIRLGINLLLGSKIDEQMTDSTSMFLPDLLHHGVESSIYGKSPFAMPNKALRQKTFVPTYTADMPFWVLTGVLVLLMISYFVPKLIAFKKTLNFMLLFVTGALGFFILFMWLGTEHIECKNNWNILWALPPNLIIAFLIFKKRNLLKTYALVGISLLLVTLIVNVIGIQQMPLMEILPFLAAMMFVYVDMYKNNVVLQKPQVKSVVSA